MSDLPLATEDEVRAQLHNLQTDLLQAAMDAAPGSNLRQVLLATTQNMPTAHAGGEKNPVGVEVSRLLNLLDRTNALIVGGGDAVWLRYTRNGIENAIDLVTHLERRA